MRYLLALLLVGCASTQPERTYQLSYLQRCGQEILVLKPGMTWLPEDERQIPSFRAGCVRRYGKNVCVRRITKVRPLGYWVVCGRDE